MQNLPSPSILVHFAELEDPRIARTKEHLRLDIVAIAIWAVICGAGEQRERLDNATVTNRG